jgi:hypothetical protein
LGVALLAIQSFVRSRDVLHGNYIEDASKHHGDGE